MKNTYNVNVEITLIKTFEIEAESEKEAEEIVREMYADGKILLDASEDNSNVEIWTMEN